MRLKTLLVSGFKSFLDAKLDFPQGVMAVVGPNGAGKSNVVDAMLWVLGEQSTKALRGERMEDVIFNGTESRQPLGMAEVSLVVSDVTDQELESVAGVMESLPGNRELMVTRRLYRDGDSEYSINKIPCRLKDIRSLFWEARVGARGHTVIEQGNIDHLLSGSPQDRRTFIEETAGIIRFKKQKLEALRKLDITQQNLVRVRDIIAEVRKQLQTLTRQARQAEQYQTMKAEVRTLELRLLKHEYDGLDDRRTRIEADLAQVTSQEAELMAEQARLMASHEALKSTLLQDGEQVGHMREALRRLDHDAGQTLTTLEVERSRADLLTRQRAQALEEQTRLSADAEQAVTAIKTMREQAQRAEEDIARVSEQVKALETQERTLAEERAALQTKTEQARQGVLDCAVERSHAESQRTNLGAKQEELVSRLQDMEAGQDRHRREQTEAEAALAGHTTQLQEVTRHLDAARERHAALSAAVADLEERLREAEEHRSREHTRRVESESRLRTLQAVLQEEFGYQPGRDGERPSLRAMCQGVKQALAERVDVPQSHEAAIEAVLGEHLRAWVVQGVEVIPQALAFLKEHGLGRGAFVTMQPRVSSSEPFAASWPALRKAPGVLGRAVDLIAVPDDLKAVWQCLLERVVLVETLADGLSAMRHVVPADCGGVLLVTRNGEVLDPRGLVTGGAGDGGGLLQRRREVRVLEQDVASMDQRLAEHDRRRQTVQEELETQKSEQQTLAASLNESETRRLLVDKETSVLTSQLEEMAERRNAHQAGHDACQAELTDVREQAALAETRLGELAQRQREDERRLEELTAQLRGCDEATGALYKQLTDARLEFTTNRERHERVRADVARLQEEDQSRRARLQGLAEQAESLQAQTLTSREEQQRADAAFRDLEANKTELERNLSTVETRHADELQQSREGERRLNDHHKQCASVRDARGKSEIQLAEIRTRIDTIEETLRGTYGESPDVDAASLLSSSAAAAPDPEGDGDGPESWRERLQTIRARMDRMGPLNLAAIDEHRDLEERHRFLGAQETDLSDSIQSLQEIIERLNRTTNRMFRETFAALQEKFKEVFAALFAGGKAELVLVKPDADEEREEGQEEDGEDDMAVDHGVDIVAQPPGKRLKNLTMLSGGEKALTVLALLFASFLIKPSPFCILDEVDAPLDEPNVIRFARFLTQLTALSQFLVITHNKRTMEVANALFGVTMEEPGVSKFVSVRIADLENVQG